MRPASAMSACVCMSKCARPDAPSSWRCCNRVGLGTRTCAMPRRLSPHCSPTAAAAHPMCSLCVHRRCQLVCAACPASAGVATYSSGCTIATCNDGYRNVAVAGCLTKQGCTEFCASHGSVTDSRFAGEAEVSSWTNIPHGCVVGGPIHCWLNTNTASTASNQSGHTLCSAGYSFSASACTGA